MCVCTRVAEEVLMCVCGGGGGVFEEMMRVLKILVRGSQTQSEMPGLLKILMMVHHTRSGDNNRVL